MAPSRNASQEPTCRPLQNSASSMAAPAKAASATSSPAGSAPNSSGGILLRSASSIRWTASIRLTGTRSLPPPTLSWWSLPEYNHSFPAPLKAIIDAAKSEWEAKPVAFVSYGGISGGLRAVEQLRGVFAELHAVGIRDQVSFAFARSAFDPAGKPRDGEAVGQAFDVMFDRLSWWAEALSSARAERPYREKRPDARPAQQEA